ncbi:MAG TPA: NAD(P)/FAD-dependent oxidoreductase [Leptospiraceae bacterium]|nr:NAD(P)/FAD-dependent oxidoreductase [Leptospiraceae bacterium]
MENSENRYDVIFIGSGIGSLTAASLLAQFRKSRVLILERHFQAGGFTHEFKRKQNKYSWDVGIHYIGDLQEGSLTRKVFDTITKGNLKWNRMAEPFERFVYPEGTFAVYGDPERYKSDLISQFPEEKDAIEKYFKDVKKMAGYFGKHMLLKLMPPAIESLASLFDPSEPIMTVKDYMDRHFKDYRLKAILASQWGDYGLPPSIASFAIHALVVYHYLNGGYFPDGGSGKILECIEPIVEENGGKILTSHEVTEVLIENGKAVGVKVKHLRGREENPYENFYAPNVVSCAGAVPTYMKLIPQSYPIAFREDLQKFYKSNPRVSHVSMYLGLSKDPRELGFNGENYWIYSNYDHDRNFAERNSWPEKPIAGAYLSFPSLKNPSAKSHTAEIIAFTDYENFEKWKDSPWKKRGEEYEALKTKIKESLLDYINGKFPGFKDIVEFSELSTPVTNEHFTGHPMGMIYGLPCVPDRFNSAKCPWFSLQTPVENLYLTGADASSPGVSGAMMGGLNVAIKLMDGFDFVKMLLRGK